MILSVLLLLLNWANSNQNLSRTAAKPQTMVLSLHIHTSLVSPPFSGQILIVHAYTSLTHPIFERYTPFQPFSFWPSSPLCSFLCSAWQLFLVYLCSIPTILLSSFFKFFFLSFYNYYIVGLTSDTSAACTASFYCVYLFLSFYLFYFPI